MGAWGNGVWQDDVADDVLIAFEDALRDGLTAGAALRRVLDDPPYGWDDEDDSATQLLAIAALALQHELLDPDLRERAIAMIDSGVPMWRWERPQWKWWTLAQLHLRGYGRCSCAARPPRRN